MKKGVLGRMAARILMKEGVGYNPKRDERQRKRVKSETINEDIIQINMKVSSPGKKKIEDLLGKTEEEEKKEE